MQRYPPSADKQVTLRNWMKFPPEPVGIPQHALPLSDRRCSRGEDGAGGVQRGEARYRGGQHLGRDPVRRLFNMQFPIRH